MDSEKASSSATTSTVIHTDVWWIHVGVAQRVELLEAPPTHSKALPAAVLTTQVADEELVPQLDNPYPPSSA